MSVGNEYVGSIFFKLFGYLESPERLVYPYPCFDVLDNGVDALELVEK